MTQVRIYSYNVAMLSDAIVNKVVVSSCLFTRCCKKSRGTIIKPKSIELVVVKEGLKVTPTNSEVEVGDEVDMARVSSS